MDARILVVDDDPDIIKMLEEAFSRSGYYVDVAGDVAQAMTLLGIREYDVLVTDKNLDDNEEDGGLRLLRYLREQGKRTEAIMITGHATIETAIEAMRLGAFDYIIKPFSLGTLKKKINRIVEFLKFLNPDSTIKSFKAFHNDLLSIFENRNREIGPETDEAIKSVMDRVEYFFTVQKERERIMIEQREALAEISSDAEELKETLAEKGETLELLERICELSSRRL
jgi:ActR/RegA family two-component response regulator